MSTPPQARLLIIDDDARLRGFLAEELALEGYAVAEAGDGQTALQAARRGESDLPAAPAGAGRRRPPPPAEELEDAGCTVLRCADGGALLAAEALAGIELVLLDLMMPGLDGLSCLRALRAGGFAGRVVMITALCDPAQKQQALAAGANYYRLKTELLAGVETLLGG